MSASSWRPARWSGRRCQRRRWPARKSSPLRDGRV